jgi:hypothetical protein
VTAGRITEIHDADTARAELVKIYNDPAVPVFARFAQWERFPYEVGYRTHNGSRVVHVVVGRGASWVNALDNAERKIVRQRRGAPIRRPRTTRTHGALPFAGDLFGGKQ